MTYDTWMKSRPIIISYEFKWKQENSRGSKVLVHIIHSGQTHAIEFHHLRVHRALIRMLQGYYDSVTIEIY